MFNEANKKQVLEMQDQFYSDRVGKVYGDFEVTRVWYDWDARRQMWELTCQKCGRKKITHNRKNHILGRFDRKEDAIAARKAGEIKYFGREVS